MGCGCRERRERMKQLAGQAVAGVKSVFQHSPPGSGQANALLQRQRLGALFARRKP